MFSVVRFCDFDPLAELLGLPRYLSFMQRFVLKGALGVGLIFTSACGSDRATVPVRTDATPVLRLPVVASAIRAFMQQNQPGQSGLFYIDAVRHGDSTRIAVSSLVSRSEVVALAPCALNRLNGQWVLVKASDCNHTAHIDSLLDQEVPHVLVDNRTRRYQVQPGGDTIFFLPENVYYHPRVLSLVVFWNQVVHLQEQDNG